MLEFREWLAKLSTNNRVADAICASLHSWRNKTTLPHAEGNLLGLQDAMDEQASIGWSSALEGRWSTKWIDVQERHFAFIHVKRSGKRWLTEVIKQLWNVAWDLWDHRNSVQASREL